MKTWIAALLTFGLAQTAAGAEPDFSSPYDTNPRCAERTTDANSPECLVKDDAGPIVVRPPVVPQPPTTQPPPPKPAPTSPLMRGTPRRAAGG